MTNPKFSAEYLAQRRDGFERLYAPDPNSGCWIWIGDAQATLTDLKSLRLKITVRMKKISAYRFSYEMFNGPIPDGAMVCHKCNVSLCVNPRHLYLGDWTTNYADCVKAGRVGRKNGRFVAIDSARTKP